MSMDWFRWYHGTVNDPKWRVVARKAGCSLPEAVSVFAAFVERASQTNDAGSIEGWDAEDIGAGLDIDAETVVGIHAAMQGKVLDGDTLTGWRKRQPKREREGDNSTERSRRHREAKKSAISDDATPCNATQRQETPRLRLDETREEERAKALLSPAEPTTPEPEARSIAEQEAFDAYNAVAARIGIPLAQKFDQTRRAKLRQRLKDCGGLAGWEAALGKVEESGYCRGRNERGWVADLDFLLQNQSFTRLMEGRYDDRKPKPSNNQPQGRVASDDEIRRRLAAAVGFGVDDGQQCAGQGR